MSSLDLWLHEDLAELPFHVRYIFIGLFTQADREGRLDDRPKRLKIALLPYDLLDMDQILDQLHDAGFIVRYRVGDVQKYIQIVNFLKHQRPHINEADSVIPAQAQPRLCLGHNQGRAEHAGG